MAVRVRPTPTKTSQKTGLFYKYKKICQTNLKKSVGNKLINMDKRLEKIRHFEANVMDFESYINDRIKQTKAENRSKDIFEATENIPEECIEYVVSNVDDFERRYDMALDKIEHYRCSLSFADSNLYDEICDAIAEWRNNNDLPENDDIYEEIEEIFM